MTIKLLDKKIKRSRRKAINSNKQRYKALCRKPDESVVEFRRRAKKHLYKS